MRTATNVDQQIEDIFIATLDMSSSRREKQKSARLTVKLEIVDNDSTLGQQKQKHRRAVKQCVVCVYEAIEFTIRWILMTFPSPLRLHIFIAYSKKQKESSFALGTLAHHTVDLQQMIPLDLLAN